MAVEEIRGFTPERCEGMLGQFAKSAREANRFVTARQEIRKPVQQNAQGQLPSLGPWNAPITLVLFSDFGCDDCMRGAFLTTAVRNLYPEKIRLVFRQFPKNPKAQLAAEASLAAHAQGKFWPFYDKLYGNPHERDRAALVRYAKEVGVDVQQLERDLDGKRFAPAVQADLDLGRVLNVARLPALFVQGRPVSFPYGADELSRLVDATNQLVKGSP